MIRPANDNERDALLNGLAHAAALYERLPPNWVRIGETAIVQDILARLAPPERRKSDASNLAPMALRVARKHIGKLLKRSAP